MSAPVWDLNFVSALGRGPDRFVLEVCRHSHAARVAVSGPSGIGKSLLLQTISGLVRADRGYVRLSGETLQDTAQDIWRPPQQRRVGYMFQNYALFPHLTVAQNVAFGTRQGWLNPRRGELDRQVTTWLDRLELSRVAGLYPHQISGGQAQRTALARTLMASPRALLLDEPFAALDPSLRLTLGAELLSVLDELSLPILLVTHDPAEAERLMDEVWTLGT